MSERNEYNAKDLRDARDRFYSLVGERAPERKFQELFTECPYIFSLALPLRIDPHEIIPLGRPGEGGPDFMFYSKPPRPFTSFGAIELKRPDSTILTLPRKEIVTLSRDAATAIAQASIYAKGIPERVLVNPHDVIFLGSGQYVFVIMGLSSEIAHKITSDALKQQLTGLFPPGCRILTYDELFRLFHSAIPSRFILFVPETADSHASINGKIRLVRTGDFSGLPIEVDLKDGKTILELFKAGYVRDPE